MRRSVRHVFSGAERAWTDKDPLGAGARVRPLRLSGREQQAMRGFGACFNELGYKALLLLGEEERQLLMSDLFEPREDGCNFSQCRLPIGANDYAEDWYSLDESEGDYAMERFSLERDERSLIPYVRLAAALNPGLGLFASPWSPPAWMKSPKVYNWGKLVRTEENLEAYALYLARFVEEYAARGIRVGQVHVQNEPVANQKFPSCMWTGEELRDFIRDHLGPLFARRRVPSEIWLGTINAPGCDYRRLIFDKWATEDYDYFANTVLMDDEARRHIAGVSYQWGGKIAIQRTFESWWPEIRLMQTENECGFGDNSWEYARYSFTMLKHYISNGAESYAYWNMILPPRGLSTWGDPQNAMITIDPETRRAVRNPDYYLMKHFSAFVREGAVLLGTSGPLAGDTLAFRNPDGSLVLEVLNPFKAPLAFCLELEDELYRLELEPESINSVVLR